MNVIPKQEDTIVSMIEKRIRYFRDVRERYGQEEIRNICQVKISTLEMILKDIYSLQSLKKKL